MGARVVVICVLAVLLSIGTFIVVFLVKFNRQLPQPLHFVLGSDHTYCVFTGHQDAPYDELA